MIIIIIIITSDPYFPRTVQMNETTDGFVRPYFSRNVQVSEMIDEYVRPVFSTNRPGSE